jgi:hypothetical protein
LLLFKSISKIIKNPGTEILKMFRFKKQKRKYVGFAEKVCGALDTRRKGEAVY